MIFIKLRIHFLIYTFLWTALLTVLILILSTKFLSEHIIIVFQQSICLSWSLVVMKNSTWSVLQYYHILPLAYPLKKIYFHCEKNVKKLTLCSLWYLFIISSLIFIQPERYWKTVHTNICIYIFKSFPSKRSKKNHLKTGVFCRIFHIIQHKVFDFFSK